MHGRIPRLVLAAPVAAALVVTLTASGSVPHHGTGADSPALRSISSRLDGATSTVLIEASEPVAYLTSQPDPLTVLVDLRNVQAGDLDGRPLVAMLAPVTGVDIEGAVAPDGVPVARVRVRLDHAARHRVRSSRNTIFVEVDRSGSALTGAPPPASTPLLRAVSGAASQTPAPPRSILQPTANAQGQRQFSGDPVTLDFQGADLRAVLRTFAEISNGLNIVIDSSIQGSVDVSLRDVPWDQALDIILRANKLGYSVDGNIVRIAPLSVLSQENEERKKLEDATALVGELRLITRPLSYAKAADLVPIIIKSTLSSRGDVQIDGRTNTLIIRDLADRLQAASDLIVALDQPQPQVEIEARIITINRNFAKELGISWGFNGRVDPSVGTSTGLTFPSSAVATGQTGNVNPAAPSALGLALGSVNGALNLDVALRALESSGKVRIVSSPRVSTQNNVEAEIKQGSQIPVQTVANNTVTVTFQDAALTLRVTPQITAANTVIMRIFVEKAEPDYSQTSAAQPIPAIDTQRASTTVLVADGDTTVIGGIYNSLESTTNDRTPLLHRIPFLGWLFRNDTNRESQDELLIFITPKILK